MWILNNETAYQSERTWTRDKHGHHHWIVIVKATFEFDIIGQLRLADEQLPPLHEPEYYGEPGVTSLRYEADLVPRKPATDVVLNAYAHAPGGRPSQEVQVGVRISQIEKSLLVRGCSRYEFGLTGPAISTPEPFVSRPIRYEHAFGGTDVHDSNPANHRIDKRNPVGAGVAFRDEHLYGRPAPSVFYPRGDPAKVGPAGLGAVASYWSPRLELAGTYDQRWAATKRPLLPDDYDERHLLCAPLDQRPREHLVGGERIELSNMTPEGIVGFELPRIALRATTRLSGRNVEHGFELATVVIETEERRLTMAWQSSLPVPTSDIDYLDVTRIREAGSSS